MTQYNVSEQKFARRSPRTGLQALLAAGLAISLLTNPSIAHAKRHVVGKPPATKTSPKQKSVNKVTYQRSTSEETTAERDRRMFRECRGLPNAGACRGYTRK